MKVTLMGIDLAKTIFQVCGVNQAGKSLFNRTIRRAGPLSFVSRYPDAVACLLQAGVPHHLVDAVSWCRVPASLRRK